MHSIAVWWCNREEEPPACPPAVQSTNNANVSTNEEGGSERGSTSPLIHPYCVICLLNFLILNTVYYAGDNNWTITSSMFLWTPPPPPPPPLPLTQSSGCWSIMSQGMGSYQRGENDDGRQPAIETHISFVGHDADADDAVGERRRWMWLKNHQMVVSIISVSFLILLLTLINRGGNIEATHSDDDATRTDDSVSSTSEAHSCPVQSSYFVSEEVMSIRNTSTGAFFVWCTVFSLYYQVLQPFSPFNSHHHDHQSMA